ncbi:DNA-binding protein [Marinilabiliaceae bacterium JC017]|nr:DNA-binding protein [Marinilabiliaceae bacterium JC017]
MSFGLKLIKRLITGVCKVIKSVFHLFIKRFKFTHMKHKAKTIAKRNPAKPEEAPKYYLNPVYTGTYTFDDLAKDIADISTVSEIDSAATLRALVKVLPNLLSKGIRVNMEGLGIFSLGINCEGSETEDEVTVEKIKRIRLRFAPAHDLKKEISKTDFEKVN